MCGIWGTIVTGKSGLFLAEKNFVYDAIVTGAVRGDHGTGVMFAPAKSPEFCVYMKKAKNPYWLLYDKDWPRFSKIMEDTAKFVVGHNRWATKGNHSDVNAHPFQHEHITMVHNGTISSGIKYDKGVEVDSHALTIALAEQGIDVFSKIYGAFACVWHDAKTKTLNIAKNYERPMHMVQVQDGDIFFASEEDMLKWLVKRSHKNYTKLELKDIPIENNKLYTFDLEGNREMEVTPLPEKKPYTPSTTTVWGKTSDMTGDAACREVTPINRKKSKNHDYLVRFHIKKKTLQKVGNMDLWLYFGKSLDDEAIWFQSKDEYPMGDSLYEGEIAEYKQNAYNYYGNNVMWYKVRTKSILLIDKDQEYKELEDELNEEQLFGTPANFHCVDCGKKLLPGDYKKAMMMKVSDNNFQFLCAECVTEYKNFKIEA